jgi:tRNA-dihydrouridine synthase C
VKNTLVFSSGLKFPRFFPGPMEGVMVPLFCQAFHLLHLTEGWLTPFYRVTTNVPRDAKLKTFIQPYMENNLPVIVQLMGTDASLLAKVAERMVFLGAKGINLNFACPSRQVLKSGTGGALLQDIPLMLEILHRIKNTLPETSLSAKIRCGFADWRESENIIPALTGTGYLDFIGVHFRTVKENYSPVPLRGERLKHIVALAGKVPVIGSGDVFSQEDAQKILELGCAGVMVARGVLRNPFLIHNLQQTEKKLSSEEGRQYFFKTLQKIAEADEKLYSRNKFLEYATMMWGANSKQFSKIKKLSAKELLDFDSDEFTK